MIISNSSITYNFNSTERYIILNDLVFGTVYNISVAAVNSVGRGLFSDPMSIEIGIGMYLYYISSVRMCFYSVPGPVGSVSSIMDTTWAVISWNALSYTPPDYPIISYEIGYYTLASGNCSLDELAIDSFAANALKFLNASNTSTSTTITGLSDNTCYIFGVCAGTVNGYGLWTFFTNETLELPTKPSPTISPSNKVTTPSSSGIDLST